MINSIFSPTKALYFTLGFILASFLATQETIHADQEQSYYTGFVDGKAHCNSPAFP